MSQAVSDQIAGYNVDLDANGIPQLPTELEHFSTMLLEPDSAEFELIVDGIYDMWKKNQHRPVQVIPRHGAEVTPCREGDHEVIFDLDAPVEEDYSTVQEYLVAAASQAIHTAAAKKLCSGCPLAAQCLASSLTNYAYKNGKPHYTRLELAESGIWGGWGPGAREYLFDAVVARWSDDENGYCPEYFEEKALAEYAA